MKYTFLFLIFTIGCSSTIKNPPTEGIFRIRKNSKSDSNDSNEAYTVPPHFQVKWLDYETKNAVTPTILNLNNDGGSSSSSTSLKKRPSDHGDEKKPKRNRNN